MKLIKAYAKINVGLRVIKKRDNGYHELKMVNDLIDLADDITIEKNDYDQLIFQNSALNPEIDDLVLKIKRAFCTKYQIADHHTIIIDKKIPLGSGLGGASSDCATVIKYLNCIYNLNISQSELIDFSKSFGADIPYFIYSDTSHSLCLVEGIGDIVSDYHDLVNLNRYIIYPNLLISTKEVFMNNYIYNKEEDILYHNDLEDSCFRVYPKMKEIKEYLLHYFNQVVMSGSGSSFVGYDLINDINNIKKEHPDWLVIKGERPWKK